MIVFWLKFLWNPPPIAKLTGIGSGSPVCQMTAIFSEPQYVKNMLGFPAPFTVPLSESQLLSLESPTQPGPRYILTLLSQ